MAKKKIEIRTKEDFISMKTTGDYILMNDIDFEGEAFNGRPIIPQFAGYFDGNGHTLRNFSVKGSYSFRVKDYWGVFGHVYGGRARITNLHIAGATMYGKYRTGAIAGWLEKGAVIENCSVTGSTFTGSGDYCGMICGQVNYVAPEFPETVIRNCTVSDCRSEWSGIAGKVNYGLIEDCIVDNCRIEVEYHAAALAYELYQSTARRCVVKNSVLDGSARDMFAGREDSEVIDCCIEGQEKEISPQEKLRCILESADAYGQLKDLEELSLWGLYTGAPVAFPEVITRLTKLKRLNLGNNSWTGIPASITNLAGLEELQLDAALCYVKELPDLSGLKKLKILRANGNNWTDTRPLPDARLVKSFFAIDSLEHLAIDKWGERSLHAEILRTALTSGQLEGISRLKKLKILDLDHNSLENLPEEIKDMPLEYISLENNRLDKETCNTWQDSMPQTIFNFRNNEPPASSGKKYEIDAMLKQAASLLGTNNAADMQNALGLYNLLEEYFTTGIIDDEYQYTYVLYGKVYAYSYLTSWYRNRFSKEQLDIYDKEQAEAAYKALEQVRQHPAMHFSGLGGLQRDLTRRAANSIGWSYVGNKITDKDKLNEIVEIVQLGIDRIENTDHYYVYDTMVRLLIKAGRQADAYPIVRKCLTVYPSFGDFQDFRTNKEYLQWIENNNE